MSLVKERQKMILLADKSPFGWKTVLEYEHHDLADDEEDGKKIYRAEAQAARDSKRFVTRSNEKHISTADRTEFAACSRSVSE